MGWTPAGGGGKKKELISFFAPLLEKEKYVARDRLPSHNKTLGKSWEKCFTGTTWPTVKWGNALICEASSNTRTAQMLLRPCRTQLLARTGEPHCCTFHSTAHSSCSTTGTATDFPLELISRWVSVTLLPRIKLIFEIQFCRSFTSAFCVEFCHLIHEESQTTDKHIQVYSSRAQGTLARTAYVLSSIWNMLLTSLLRELSPYLVTALVSLLSIFLCSFIPHVSDTSLQPWFSS